MNSESNITISVIVPVYNVEQFVRPCIESILRQSVNNLQIILIDDGSVDTSGVICDELAQKDSRIQVIHEKNAGVSVARNLGLDIAEGHYISFVDSDDILPSCAYELLLSKAKPGMLTMGLVQRMTEDGKLERPELFKTENITQHVFLEDLFSEKIFPYLGYPVDKLFEREIIERFHLRFNPQIRLNEDRLFVLEYMMHCPEVQFADNTVYYYRQRNTGVIAQTRRNITVTDNEMTVVDSFGEMKRICKNYSDHLYRVCSRKAFESALDLLNRVSKDDIGKIRRLNTFLWENLNVCLDNPEYHIKDKVKLLGHAILRR